MNRSPRTVPEPRWARWRAGRLLKAGFPAELAERLARAERLDLHELLELVDRGCPPRLAERILAPLDDLPEPAAPRRPPTASRQPPTAGREGPAAPHES